MPAIRVSGTGLALPPWESGFYYFPMGEGSTSTSNTLTDGMVRVTPAYFPACRLVRIGAEITVVGQAASKLRLGIYADNGFGRPDALVVDAGQIAGDSATVQELTIDVTLGAGIYWIGGAVQAAATTQPTVRIPGSFTAPIALRTANTIPGASFTAVAFTQSSVSGALPANFTSAPGTGGAVPRVFVRTF